jgi:hypothetical protein
MQYWMSLETLQPRFDGRKAQCVHHENFVVHVAFHDHDAKLGEQSGHNDRCSMLDVKNR